MRRFFIAAPLTPVMQLSNEDAHHIKNVLRMKSGDNIIIISRNTGQACIAEINDVSKSETVFWREGLDEQKEPFVRVILAQGLPKSDKMDYIVQKSVELGITEIWPLETEHCITRYVGDKKKQRQERWQKIAAEAAKQCGRHVIPLVGEIICLEKFLCNQQLDNEKDKTVIMLYEKATEQGLKEILTTRVAMTIVLLVGPEGGFSRQEVELSQKYSAQVVSIGPRILRTETAALAAVAVTMYECGDLGGG